MSPRGLGLIAVALGLGLFARARPARAEPVLTLAEAVRLARHNHPTVEAQRAQVAIAHARDLQALAGLLPVLQGSVAYQPQTPNLVPTPSSTRAFLTANGTDTVIDARGVPTLVTCRTPGVGGCAPLPSQPSLWSLTSFWSLSAGIGWTAWDWGRSIYGWKSAQALAEAQRVGVVTAQRNVALDVKSAFFTAIAADEQLLVAEEAVANFEQHVAQTRAFREAGLRTGIDVATAQSGLAQVALTRARAVAARTAARTQLAAALGPDTSLERWQGVRLELPPGAFELQPGDLEITQAPPERLIGRALAERTELAQLRLRATGYDRAAKAARGQYLPALTLGLQPSWASSGAGATAGNLELSIALGFPSGGLSPVLVHGQVKEAEGNLLATRAEARATRDAIEKEALDAQALLAAAREELVAGQALVEAAARQRALAEGRYASGIGNIIELSDALLTFVNARFQLVQARLDLAIARARVEHALGLD